MEAHNHGARLASTLKAKRELEGEDEDDEMVDEDDEEENEDEGEDKCDFRKKKIMDLGSSVGLGKKGSTGSGVAGGGVTAASCCQVEKCGADLTFAKTYHKRHKVCEVHAKAPAVLLNGVDQRFCQQCSRFHEVSEFDEAKRSCRRRLAGHNERRRKASSENRGGEGSSRRRVEPPPPPLKESKQCSRGGSQLIISAAAGTSSYENFHIH